MTGFTVKEIDEIDCDEGPKAIPGITFHGAARHVGFTGTLAGTGWKRSGWGVDGTVPEA